MVTDFMVLLVLLSALVPGPGLAPGLGLEVGGVLPLGASSSTRVKGGGSSPGPCAEARASPWSAAFDMADEVNAVGVVGVGVVVAMPARARMELASTTSLTDT